MHEEAKIAGSLFAKIYGKQGAKVLDVGGADKNGSLRGPFLEIIQADYTCIDIEKDASVDIVIDPSMPFPFPDQIFDIIVSSSCFEHDPCFWVTFREMCRVIKKDGHIYVCAPSSGAYHGYPGDNWRFYVDSGQALAYWAGKTIEHKSYPVKVEECFHIEGYWNDLVTVWKRTDVKEETIKLDDSIKKAEGPLRKAIHDYGRKTF